MDTLWPDKSLPKRYIASLEDSLCEVLLVPRSTVRQKKALRQAAHQWAGCREAAGRENIDPVTDMQQIQAWARRDTPKFESSMFGLLERYPKLVGLYGQRRDVPQSSSLADEVRLSKVLQGLRSDVRSLIPDHDERVKAGGVEVLGRLRDVNLWSREDLERVLREYGR